MSPTSYQAAPPRDSTSKVRTRVHLSRQTPVASTRQLEPAIGTSRPLRSCRGRRRIGPVREPIQNLLVAAHHPEHLARNTLLRRRIVLHEIGVSLERIDDVSQRIDRSIHARPLLLLPDQIERAELAALYRKHERRTDHDQRDHTLDESRR